MPERRRGNEHRELRDRVDAACGELGRAFRGDAVSLEPATRAFAAVLRRAGLPIQRLVALLTYCASDDRLSFEQRERLAQQRQNLVRWAIDAYYGADE